VAKVIDILGDDTTKTVRVEAVRARNVLPRDAGEADRAILPRFCMDRRQG